MRYKGYLMLMGIINSYVIWHNKCGVLTNGTYEAFYATHHISPNF